MSRKSRPTGGEQEGVFFSLALSRIPGVGHVTFKRLIEKFETPRRVFEAAKEDFQGIEGIRSKTVEAILSFSGDDRAEEELDRVVNLGATLLTLTDPRYPQNLKSIYDPPPILYLRGDLQERDHLAVAMVGSRNASPYGKEVTGRMAQALSLQGLTIVSGLARGIDTAAHRGALKGGGRTLAVLGSGIDVIYPWENRTLGEEITGHGAIISEFPLGTPPEAIHFPARNRIISGLSLGTVIIEASLRSGSLITARMALEQGREVFAVPGNVNSVLSKGTNRLIREGAKLVMEPEDVIEEILPQAGVSTRPDPEPLPEPTGLSPEGQKIYGLVTGNPIHIDTLIQNSGLSSPQVASLLLDLELRGLVRQLSGKMFKRELSAEGKWVSR